MLLIFSHSFVCLSLLFHFFIYRSYSYSSEWECELGTCLPSHMMACWHAIYEYVWRNINIYENVNVNGVIIMIVTDNVLIHIDEVF